MGNMEGGSSEQSKKKGGVRSLYKEKGLVGVVTGAPKMVGRKSKEVLFGQKQNTDSEAPVAEFRRNQFIVDIDNKGDVQDEHGREEDQDKRKDHKANVEKLYPRMEDFWVQHVENLAKVVNTHPDLLNDKSSYIYHQYLQAKAFTTDPGPKMIGQLEMGKLRTYFQTPAGYSETMRYMEEELMRLECANNLVELTKNRYEPGGLDAVNLGLITQADRLAAVAQLGSKMAIAAEAILVTAYTISKVLPMLTPNAIVLGGIPFPGLLPLIAGGAIAAIPFGIMIKRLDQYLKTNTYEQIMQQCDSMFLAMSHSPSFASERTYLREMYHIDPGELRFTPPPKGSPPGTQSTMSFMDGGITTGGWDKSKQLILKIKQDRKFFYDQVLNIPERSMFGVPEEAFFDNAGQYREQVMPEGQAVMYQQDIWNRFEQLGAHFTIDTGTGLKRRLNPDEAIARFQQARREVIMTGVQKNAETIIQNDRKNTLAEQNNVLLGRVTLIDKANGQVRKHEREGYDKISALATELNDGSPDGKQPGLRQYAGEWKGTEPGSVETRLGELTKARQDIYKEISVIIPYPGQIEGLTADHIQQAIVQLKDSIDVKKKVSGTPGERLADLDADLVGVPAKIGSGVFDSKGKETLTDNSTYVRLMSDRDTVIAEISDVKKKLQELELLKVKLGNERAKYNPTNEHGKAFGETLKKMESARKTLNDALTKRAVPLGGTNTVETILEGYPSLFTVASIAPPPATVTRSGLEGIIITLANETGLWNEDENDFHEHKMTIIFAVASARAQTKLSALDATGGKGALEYVTGGKTVSEIWKDGGGTFNEMTVMANNATELAGMGIVGGVNMSTGENTRLKDYAQARYEIYTQVLQDLMAGHDIQKRSADKQANKVDEKYDAQEARYTVITELIKEEKEGSKQSKKISAQVNERGLTGRDSVRKFTDRRNFASRDKLEQDKYLDYEQEFLLKFPEFPPAMLEFLDVVFDYRKNTGGQEKLKILYDLLVDMAANGVDVKRAPQIMLADIIYQSHPSIAEMLYITPDEGKFGTTIAGVVLTEKWDTIVLRAFNNRQFGYPSPPPPSDVYKPFVPRPYSTSEMNTIFVSIQHQIIEKAVNKGVVVTG